jgi:hypothetical protein
MPSPAVESFLLMLAFLFVCALGWYAIRRGE